MTDRKNLDSCCPDSSRETRGPMRPRSESRCTGRSSADPDLQSHHSAPERIRPSSGIDHHGHPPRLPERRRLWPSCLVWHQSQPAAAEPERGGQPVPMKDTGHQIPSAVEVEWCCCYPMSQMSEPYHNRSSGGAGYEPPAADVGLDVRGNQSTSRSMGITTAPCTPRRHRNMDTRRLAVTSAANAPESPDSE